MKLYLDGFYEMLNRPLAKPARLILAVLVIPLAFALTQPLWRISLVAPQYPRGLLLEIYAHQAKGGNGGADLQEINTLNHYIGMRPLNDAAFADLDWIPFAFGALAIFALRIAVIGNIRGLVDLAVLTLYMSLFAAGRFVYMLYSFGHHLDPRAPMKIDPFMPVVFGSKKIANFTTSSYPSLGSGFLAVFVVGLLVVLGWHLWREYQRAAKVAQSA